MPLNLADKNKIYIIQRIVGNKDMVHRLQSLGFVVGSKIRSEERRVGKECRSRWSPYH